MDVEKVLELRAHVLYSAELADSLRMVSFDRGMMPEFITNNLLEIFLSVISIVIGITISYFFFRLQKRDVVSAREERVKRAREELVDAVENFIINKKQPSEDMINILIAASERAHAVELRSVGTPTTVLQDVALVLQRSRHLDVSQKTEYASQIEEIIANMVDDNERLAGSREDILELDKIETAIAQDQKKQAIEMIGSLKKELIEQTSPQPRAGNTSERYPTLIAQVSSVMAGLTAVVVVFPGSGSMAVVELS